MEEENKQQNPSPQTAAIQSPYDERDILFTDVAFAAPEFDWDIGVDIEKEIADAIVNPDFKIKTKDQNGSGSCGGQAEAYGGAVIEALYTKNYEERSAKFTYAPIAYPGGGATGRDLASRAKDVGWGLESLTASYDNGKPPKEPFMARKEDITQEAIDSAAKTKAVSYTLLPSSINSIAQAVRDYKFVRIGITGSDNGTWRSEFPQPPVDGEDHWYHWVSVMKAKKIDGKKFLGFKNSWGDDTGNMGWQWVGEDWFKARLSNDPYGDVAIWEPRCYVWNEQPAPSTYTHKFFKQLDYGQVDLESIEVQKALTVDGTFPSTIPYSQRFGEQTRLAVQKFQKKYGIASSGTPASTGYGRVGPATIMKLNELFDK